VRPISSPQLRVNFQVNSAGKNLSFSCAGSWDQVDRSFTARYLAPPSTNSNGREKGQNGNVAASRDNKEGQKIKGHSAARIARKELSRSSFAGLIEIALSDVDSLREISRLSARE
jgi:hypothetical protein